MDSRILFLGYPSKEGWIASGFLSAIFQSKGSSNSYQKFEGLTFGV
jgi:hypothetical protein